MTAALIVLAACLGVTIVSAVAIVARAWRAGERRERALLALIATQAAEHRETLDRVMYASGKPWRDSADRPDEPPPDPWWEEIPVVEDPVAGAGYPGFDEDFAEIGDETHSFATNGRTRAEMFDTRGLEPL